MKNLLLIIIPLLLVGCTALKDHTLVVTGTVLGVQLAENQVTGMYEAKLGYSRVETVFTPTNNPDITMEFKTAGLFSFSSNGGIYQRLVIGKEAVQSPVAAVLFMKDRNGNFNTNITDTILKLQKPTK